MRAAHIGQVAAEAAALLRTMCTAPPPSARVTAIWCRYCRHWVKPSKFTGRAAACTSCAEVLATRHRRRLREWSAR